MNNVFKRFAEKESVSFNLTAKAEEYCSLYSLMQPADLP